MGILSRFKAIMASNIHALLDQSEDPEKTVDELMRSLRLDLGTVQGESNALAAAEQRARRALEECRAELRKLSSYAEKSRELGNHADAGLFQDKRDALLPKEAELEEQYRQASSQAASLKELELKLRSDMDQLEARRAQLKERMSAAKVQQKRNAMESSIGGRQSAFDAAEEKANQAYYEAMALAELKAGDSKNLDREFEELERESKRKTPGEENRDAGM